VSAMLPSTSRSSDLPAHVARRGRPPLLPAVDGLRGLAALAIVVYHSWMYAADPEVGGQVLSRVVPHLSAGIVLFFTLSGVLLYRPFAAHLLGRGPAVEWREYGVNRLLRLLPAYWLALLFAAVVFPAALFPGFLDGSRDAVGRLADRPGLLAVNALLLQNFHPSSFLTGIGPTWTLSIELSFYAALPIAAGVTAWLFRGASGSWRVVAACTPPAAFFLLGAAVKAVTTVGPLPGAWERTWGSVLARSFAGNADLFAFGMLVAVIWHLQGDRIGRARWRPWALGAAAIIAVVTLQVPRHQSTAPLYDIGVAMASALLVGALVLGPRWQSPVAAVLDARPLRGLAVISYSLYLWHEPLIHWLVSMGIPVLGGLSAWLRTLALVVLASAAIATVAYLGVERPVMQWRQRQRHRLARPGPPTSPVRAPRPVEPVG
jgi:peptidoglycan/LPS O-acetylase OafA/YrhL